MLKRQSNISWQCFKVVLYDNIDRAENRGSCMIYSRGTKCMASYEQQKLGLNAYYNDKCWVLLDGIHTEPVKFHMT